MATIIKNLSQVVAILANLNMPKINDPAIVEISKSDYRNQFLRLIGEAEDGDRRSADALRTACECMSEVAIQCITEIGVTQISIPKLVNIAFSEKANLFKSFINSALGSKGSDREVAINKIFDHLGLTRPSNSSTGAGERAASVNSNRNHNSASSRAGEGASHQGERTSGQMQQNQNQNQNQNQRQASKPSERSGDSNAGQQHNQRNDNIANIDDYRGGPNESTENGQQRTQVFDSMSFFGANYACCFNKSDKDGKEVINIDFAEGSNRVFKWKQKVSFQCSCSEMIFLYGVLMGYNAGWVSQMHGQSDIKKTLSIEKQDGGCYISINAKGMKGVKIPYADSARVKAFVYSRIKTWFGDNNDTLIHQWIKDQCTQYTYVKPDPKKQNNNQQQYSQQQRQA